MLGSFWAHPERVLDPQARNATSGFARMDAWIVRRVVAAVTADLTSGAWERRHGHLRELESFDAGLRLITNLPEVRAEPTASADADPQRPKA
jgi:hypothetical protein